VNHFGSDSVKPLKTINECRRAGGKNTPGHSKGKPDVSFMTTNIGVRFATPLPVEIKIRHLKRLPEHNKTGPVPVPLQLAAQATATTNGEL